MSIIALETERVLQLLRRLPSREQLRVVIKVLPELTDVVAALPDAPVQVDFWGSPAAPGLNQQLAALSVANFETWLGSWPEDEPLEPFLAALAAWREQNPALGELG